MAASNTKPTRGLTGGESESWDDMALLETGRRSVVSKNAVLLALSENGVRALGDSTRY
jgi:hypothetical protein